MNITTVIEKFGRGGYSLDNIYLTEVNEPIAHTVTCRMGGIDIQHCNLILEIAESDSETKSSNETRV